MKTGCEYCLANKTPDETYEPRLLFQLALEEERCALEVKDLEFGITDLVIKQHDNGNVTLKVVIGQSPEITPEFQLATWDKTHSRGIDITLQPYGSEQLGKVPGLFEIDEIGFYGYEIGLARYKLFTEDVATGTFTLLEKFFELFPEFLQHCYLSIPSTSSDTLLHHLVNSGHFKKVKELTILEHISESWVNSMEEKLINLNIMNYA